MTTPHTPAATTTETPALTPGCSGVMLPLTPTEYGVVVALAGIGLSAMSENGEMASRYREILNTADTAEIAFTAFEKLVMALEAVTGRAA